VEDLLPFSDEALCRAVFACRTPVISAIGHETDTPLIDFVADMRASTPTDAAKRAVPDLAEEVRGLANARARLDRAMDNLLEREQHRLDGLRSRPVMARPQTMIDTRWEQVLALRSRADRTLAHRLERADTELHHTLARLRGLGPLATLERGYAIVQHQSDGSVLRDPAQARTGERLRLRLARGDLAATVSTMEGDA
jgi:exodeoxyribonuclease VII large subunit